MAKNRTGVGGAGGAAMVGSQASGSSIFSIVNSRGASVWAKILALPDQVLEVVENQQQPAAAEGAEESVTNGGTGDSDARRDGVADGVRIAELRLPWSEPCPHFASRMMKRRRRCRSARRVLREAICRPRRPADPPACSSCLPLVAFAAFAFFAPFGDLGDRRL